MKKIIIITLAVLGLCGCGKSKTSGNNEAAKRHLDAWVHVQKQKHPEYLWRQTAMGSWILEDHEGKGEALGEFTDSLFVRVDYTITDLQGSIVGTSYKRVAQQIGDYKETNYYGPEIKYANGLYAGVEDIVKGMKRGGRRKALIPAWLATYSRFNTVDEYMAQKSDEIGATSIYDIELVDYFEYMQQWSADSVARYLVANYSSRYGTDPRRAVADSSGAFGFYYIRTQAPASNEELSDTTVYINYTGRLLNGQVFDTTIRDTAIRYGLSRSKSYKPVSVTLGDNWSKVTLGDSDTKVIQGFARTISRMGPYEKGIGIFISSLGYGYNGSGSSIPAYAPLRFDVELVDKQ